MVHDCHSIQMQKEKIVEILKDRGFRITKQRLILLEIILSNECSCCKEIYYTAIKKDNKIGTATVYRMINTLEEIGAIKRENRYKVTCSKPCCMEDIYTVVLDDNTTCELSLQKFNRVMQAGLIKCGYIKNQKISSLTVKQGIAK